MTPRERHDMKYIIGLSAILAAGILTYILMTY